MQQHIVVPADELTEGLWFWHEPVPGLGWRLQVAAVKLRGDVVRIVTTDSERELVEYPRDRQVRLAETDIHAP